MVKNVIVTKTPAKLGLFLLATVTRFIVLLGDGGVGNWEEGDVPIDEHREFFETSPFVQGVDVGNIPVERSALTGG